LNQSSVALAAGTTTQFTATVQNTTNTAVTWSVNAVAGGNASVGTISVTGLYTAPSQSGSFTVMVTSVADPTKSAKATVAVGKLGALAPASVILAPSATQQFTASVQGFSNGTVNWSVDQVVGGNSTVGTISSTGLYTAPSQTGMHTVTASSAADSSLTASASVTVSTISISPTTATMIGGDTQQFTVTMPGVSNPGITWSATGGSISGGLYTAPSLVGNYTVTATSTADPSLTASAAVSVFIFTISPTSLTLAPSATEQFSTTIQGLPNTTVAWSVDGVAGGNSTAGTITSSGLYTAPAAIGAHTITATSSADPALSVSAALTVINVAQAAVLTYHNDDARDGAYTEEVNLMPENVNSTQFGKLLSYPVDGQIYGQPLYLPQISIAGGTHDVVYVTTQNNSVYAFDADATSAQTAQTFWHVNLGPSVTKDSEYGVFVVGILSTPVIDATTKTIYVVAEESGHSNPFFLHALDATTGAEKFGGPVNITGSVSGTEGGSSAHTITLEPSCVQRNGLALDPVTNAIYIGFGSCTHGWLLAYDKTNLSSAAQATAVFNATPNDNGGGGLWSSGGAPAIDDATGYIYVMTGVDFGDDISTVNNSITDGYNDAFLQMDPTNLSVLSFFMPDDNPTLADNDADLGSGGNILMPASSSYPSETIGGGKDGNIFVVNGNNMGGYSYSPQVNNVIQTLQTGSGSNPDDNIFSTPVYWNGFLYYHCNNDVLRAFNWNPSATTPLSPAAVGTVVYPTTHGATASLSANGTTNGIIWDIDNSAYDGSNPAQSGPSVLHAYDASNVATELYNSSQAGSRDTAGAASKFTSPTIAGGKVFVPTSTELDVYGLLAP
ncbi:MAG: hypothetical protein WCC85_02595, partial [Candidatus Sulfotelmatobacter sp.]